MTAFPFLTKPKSNLLAFYFGSWLVSVLYEPNLLKYLLGELQWKH